LRPGCTGWHYHWIAGCRCMPDTLTLSRFCAGGLFHFDLSGRRRSGGPPTFNPWNFLEYILFADIGGMALGGCHDPRNGRRPPAQQVITETVELVVAPPLLSNAHFTPCMSTTQPRDTSGDSYTYDKVLTQHIFGMVDQGEQGRAIS